MAETKITCPECGKVLRPAKPLPPGKRVKCPQCSALFVPGEEDAAPAVSKSPATSEAKAGSKTAAKAKPAQKTADDKPAKPKAAPRPRDDDDEGGPNTYEFIDDHRKEDEPEIDYVPDTSIKDLRGPAQEMVMKPSNWILRYGIGGFLCYFVLLVIIMLPVMFPVPKPLNADGSPATEKDKDGKDKKPQSSLLTAYNKDLMEIAAWEVIVYTFICLTGMAYCGFITYGAVKMQSLESRVWGIIVSILTMLPITTWAFFCLQSIVITIFWFMFLDEDTVLYALPVASLTSFVPNLLVGVMGLVTMLKPEVIDGYDYIPEDARTERRKRD